LGFCGMPHCTLTAICEPIVQKIWEPRRLTTLWASTACYRDGFTFIVTVYTDLWLAIFKRWHLYTWLSQSDFIQQKIMRIGLQDRKKEGEKF
jgi:hypothetical protein